jgi:hypothetical protein
VVTITYSLTPGYTETGTSGILRVTDGRIVSLHDELLAGAGTITVDASDGPLVTALDDSPALLRSGEDPGPLLHTTLTHELIVTEPVPAEDGLVATLGGDGSWVARKPRGVGGVIDLVADCGATGGADDSAAFLTAWEKMLDSRVADPDYGTGGWVFTKRIYIPEGRFTCKVAEALMSDTGDPYGNGTTGYELVGEYGRSHIVFDPPDGGPLLKVHNKQLYPKISNLLFASSNTEASIIESDSGGVAQGMTWEDVFMWGSWYRGMALEAYAKQTLTGVTIDLTNPAVFHKTAHGLVAGDAVYFPAPAGDTLPTGVTPMQTYYVAAAGLTANAFQLATTPGGFPYVAASGSQSATHTMLALAANGNDSWKLERVNTQCSFADYFWVSGVYANMTQQDQAIAHTWTNCNFDTRGGGLSHWLYGGSFLHAGGSTILASGGKEVYRLEDSGAVPHLPGAPMATVDSVRYEIRDPAAKLIDCRWKYGTVRLRQLMNDWPFIPHGQLMYRFDAQGGIGADVTFDGGDLGGSMELVHGTSDWQAGPKHVRLKGSLITHYENPRDFVTFTDSGGAGAVANKWIVRMDDDTRGNIPYNSGRQLGRANRVILGGRRALGVAREKYQQSIKGNFGTLPTSGAPITIYAPLNSALCGIETSQPAGGADTTTGVTYTLTDGDGTVLYTFTVTGRYMDGWDARIEFKKRIFDTENKRKLTLAASTASFNVEGMFEPILEPGD